MQYNHRSRVPPPPPPFGRGGGAWYPRGHRQLYAPPPPLPPVPPVPQRKYEVLMEAGRLAAEYLVSQGALPPAALQRGTGAWAVPPLPPPPPPPLPQRQQQEPPAFYCRRRYDDEYSNNPAARNRRTNGTTSSTSSRDDYSSGSYIGREKRKYGEYRRGNSDSARDREKERGRAFLNSRRYEDDDDEDGAPGFQRKRRGGRGSDEVVSSVTESAREETPLMAKVVGELYKEDTRSKVVSSIEEVQKDADAVPEVQGENEEGEVDDDSKVLSSEPEVVEQAIDADSNIGVMEAEPKQLPDAKVPDKKAEDGDKISDEAAFDHNTLDVEVTNVENNMHHDTPNLLASCDFVRAPTKARSVRACRNAASVSRGTSVAATFDIVSSKQASQMVSDESADESSLSNTESGNGEDQMHRESSVLSDEPILIEENGKSVVTENIREEKGNAQLHVVPGYKEEPNLSPFTASHEVSMPQEDSLMQETDFSPFTACHKDSLPQQDILMQETELSPLTASHKNSFIKETELSPLTVSHKDNLMQEPNLSQTMSHENNLPLQFKEGTQICDFDTLPPDVDLIELSDQEDFVGAELCPNARAKSVTEMEGGRLDQSDSLKVSDLDLVGSTEVSALQANTTLVQSSAAPCATEQHEKQQEDLGTSADAKASATDDLCQLPLENKDVQLTNIECNAPIEDGGFGSSKSKNEMICSSMDNIMHSGLQTDALPGIQDSYSLAFSDFINADIPCYPPVQSDLHAGIGANDSEGITVMDDPIYGSLTDIGFMDMWGQPIQDYDKFF
ncbi:hypothetical protein EJB05_21350 [Eragrostis curvula]|uniref:Uncharacterized protein n=1 Tax=Eragrostis curvula TaxID=38414 RepID=A0A5J9V1H8_9POAL|nr:hypothetical protein EJB05_21350 [Eragrostis curvula]